MTDTENADSAPELQPAAAAPISSRRAIDPKLTRIHQDLLTHLKDPTAWQEAVKLFYTLPPEAPPVVAKAEPAVLSDASATIAAAAKVLQSFKTTLTDDHSWAGWWLELHTRLGHLAGVQPILTGKAIGTDDVLAAELDRALAPLISATLSERIRHVVVDSIVYHPSASTLIRRLRQHLVSDAEQRAETVKSRLLAFRQGHLSARSSIEQISKLVTELASFTTPLPHQEHARILHSVPHSDGVRIKLYEIYIKTKEQPEGDQDWASTIDKMLEWFRRFGDTAPAAPAPAPVPARANPVHIQSTGSAEYVPRACNYRHCADTTRPHRFNECVAFAQRVAAGTEVPHRDMYRYRGSTPVPGLDKKWVAQPWTPVRARQVTAAALPADATSDLTAGVANVGIDD